MECPCLAFLNSNLYILYQFPPGNAKLPKIKQGNCINSQKCFHTNQIDSCLRDQNTNTLTYTLMLNYQLIGFCGKNYRKIPWISWENRWFPVKIFP